MRWLGIASVVIIAAVVLYKVSYPTTSYRFKITLNVETPQGLKSGSSVMEVTTRRYPAWTTLGQSTGTSSLNGEAVFVDLGDGTDGKPKHIIALLVRGVRGENVDFNLLPGQAFGRLSEQQSRAPRFALTDAEVLRLPPGSVAPLRGDLIPTLVTFTDLEDPTTAQVVPPDDFEQIFGKGIHFRDASLEIVSAGTWPLSMFDRSQEPLTQGIENKLPWWSGPFPWLRPIGGGVFVDSRPPGLFRWTKEQFKRGNLQ